MHMCIYKYMCILSPRNGLSIKKSRRLLAESNDSHGILAFLIFFSKDGAEGKEKVTMVLARRVTLLVKLTKGSMDFVTTMKQCHKCNRVILKKHF